AYIEDPREGGPAAPGQERGGSLRLLVEPGDHIGPGGGCHAAAEHPPRLGLSLGCQHLPHPVELQDPETLLAHRLALHRPRSFAVAPPPGSLIGPAPRPRPGRSLGRSVPGRPNRPDGMLPPDGSRILSPPAPPAPACFAGRRRPPYGYPDPGRR